MNLTETEWIIVAMLCTLSMLIGFLSGSRERRADEALIAAEDFQQHWAQARWIVRRPTPATDETVAS